MSEYKKAGVDIEVGNTFISIIKDKVKSTYNKNVINPIGGFASIFKLDLNEYKKPLLLSSTDGVGTKLKIAFMTNHHKTIGIDLFAMCANDILVYGAKPLFFLDYLATGKLDPKTSSDIIEGIVKACKEADTALVGGETAEMPSFYTNEEYDCAGFVVGVVDEDKIINGTNVNDNNVIIGLESSGLHSNGYSLVRYVFFEKHKYSIDHVFEELNMPLKDVLLKETIVYVNPILNIIDKYKINAMAHITGGGLIENIVRVFSDAFSANIDSKLINTPKIFSLIQKLGSINNEEMYRVFNMGIGFVIISEEKDYLNIINDLKKFNINAYKIGHISKFNGYKINITDVGSF